MRIQVKTDACVGHGMCRLAAPELFELSDEDGHAFVLREEPPVELEQAARLAERGCPEGAILILD